MQSRNSVPAYDLITASYLDPGTRTPLYDLTNRQWAKVFPAYANNTQAGMFLEVRANSGDAPVPQSATILGGFGTASGDYLRVYNDPAGRALWLYFGMPIFAGTGPRHLVLSYANDIYVMPQAINLVKAAGPGNHVGENQFRRKRDRHRQQLRRRQPGLLRRHPGGEVHRVQRQRPARLP